MAMLLQPVEAYAKHVVQIIAIDMRDGFGQRVFGCDVVCFGLVNQGSAFHLIWRVAADAQALHMDIDRSNR